MELVYKWITLANRHYYMGFIHDVRRVLQKLPAKRQTLFFSATMTDCENCRCKAVPDAGYAPKGFLG